MDEDPHAGVAADDAMPSLDDLLGGDPWTAGGCCASADDEADADFEPRLDDSPGGEPHISSSVRASAEGVVGNGRSADGEADGDFEPRLDDLLSGEPPISGSVHVSTEDVVGNGGSADGEADDDFEPRLDDLVSGEPQISGSVHVSAEDLVGSAGLDEELLGGEPGAAGGCCASASGEGDEDLGPRLDDLLSSEPQISGGVHVSAEDAAGSGGLDDLLGSEPWAAGGSCASAEGEADEDMEPRLDDLLGSEPQISGSARASAEDAAGSIPEPGLEGSGRGEPGIAGSACGRVSPAGKESVPDGGLAGAMDVTDSDEDMADASAKPTLAGSCSDKQQAPSSVQGRGPPASEEHTSVDDPVDVDCAADSDGSGGWEAMASNCQVPSCTSPAAAKAGSEGVQATEDAHCRETANVGPAVAEPAGRGAAVGPAAAEPGDGDEGVCDEAVRQPPAGGPRAAAADGAARAGSSGAAADGDASGPLGGGPAPGAEAAGGAGAWPRGAGAVRCQSGGPDPGAGRGAGAPGGSRGGKGEGAKSAEKVKTGLRGAAARVRRGVVVRLFGLKARPEMNGAKGLCMCPAADGRWAVHLDNDPPGIFRNVRKENLQVMSCGGALKSSPAATATPCRGKRRREDSPPSRDAVIQGIAELECEALRKCTEEERAGLKRRLLLKWHPDKAPGEANRELATKVAQAMQNLPHW